MILRPKHPIWALTFLYSLLLWQQTLVLGQRSEPQNSVTNFKNPPSRLFFFDDSTHAIYADLSDQNLYVSKDEGKSWKLAEGVQQGSIVWVIEHPFDNRIAYALSRNKEHYRTVNRGETWQKFTTPTEPALVPKPLSFHVDDDKKDYVLFQGTVCKDILIGRMCRDETYYTKDGFASTHLLLPDTTHCVFAHSSKDFKHAAPKDLVYCVAFDTSIPIGIGSPSYENSRVFSSTDYFDKDKKVEDLGIGKNARGVIAIAIVSKYAVVAMKDLSPGSRGDMLLYVSIDATTWALAQFPHASNAQLRENAYTIVESTTHSLGVDVVIQSPSGPASGIGTFFVSNSNGTYFTESLKNTNRQSDGIVDFEKIYGIDGFGMANIVGNADAVNGIGAPKQIKSRFTYDDGRSWWPIPPPSTDISGNKWSCTPSSSSGADDTCSLHFHSVTSPHNYGRVFSSPAPGFVMGVGTVGGFLKAYDECDTFLSTDGGITWKHVHKGPAKYEFGDSGTILVLVPDQESLVPTAGTVTNEIKYSLDMGDNWKTYKLPVSLNAMGLLTVPDSTSQKFILLGSVAPSDAKANAGRVVVVHLDFADMRDRNVKCGDNDFEKWYARHNAGHSGEKECILGHKQWYRRRKRQAKCFVGDKFMDPPEHDEDCPCSDADYECDFNYIREDDSCVPVGREPVPAGTCSGEKANEKYWGSSGWRKIPGNTCSGGSKDRQIEKDCSQAEPVEGTVTHQAFEFPSEIVQHGYFKGKEPTILVRLQDGSAWQSLNEGYTWKQIEPSQKFVAFYHHKFSNDRAYLITTSNNYWATTDSGKSWNPMSAPGPPNTFGAQILRFHPTSDNLIWVGNNGCSGFSGGPSCHAEAHYSLDNGRTWTLVEKYVANCAWASDAKITAADPTEILCESYTRKSGDQSFFGAQGVPLELIEGTRYFKTKKKLFNSVVGFAKFAEYLVVAELQGEQNQMGLDLQVSLDGIKFAPAQFPPNMKPDMRTHAYTILESSTDALFIHMTMSEAPKPFWGSILKSNSNGTYFGISLDYVNRNDRGYVDFEKLVGLDGIALVNVIADPQKAILTGRKALASRITHNDGGTWTALSPPGKDSQGREYACNHAGCNLHIHGYTERRDPRAIYGSPAIKGVLMGVGNVGESLAPYVDSDTFISRNGGWTWEEVHKDAHMWKFGDSGAIIIIANDEEATDHVLFTTDEGLNWKEYKFTNGEKLRISSIVTAPSEKSRKFILFGQQGRNRKTLAIHLDFSTLTKKQCTLSVQNPGNDDFELWSPSEDRPERCLFGRQTLYHRRLRTSNCVVGTPELVEDKIEKHCECKKEYDFECEFNHVRDDNGNCILVEGTSPRPDDQTCQDGENRWYSRTAYRKIPYSSCEGGERPDRGEPHECVGFKGHSAFFWFFVLTVPFLFTGFLAYWFYRKSGVAPGYIRLPGDRGHQLYDRGGIMDTIASIPWFLVGVAGIAWEWVVSNLEASPLAMRSRRGYRDIPVDEDAQILRFEDEE